jgi:hypothetical protein
MPAALERLRTIALGALTEAEARACIVYLASAPVGSGEELRLPGVTVRCPAPGHLAFADLDPAANWGHRCCYICIDGTTGAIERVDAQFPPFGKRDDEPLSHWQMIYRAPGVPDAFVASPGR